MRALVRVVLALLLAAAAGIGAVAWLLPRWASGEEFRELLLGAARDATGRDVGYDELSLALFPLRLVATNMRVGDPAAPLVVSEHVAMSVALAPLLQRVVQIDSLALDAVTWRIVRSAGGIELPIAKQVAAREAVSVAPRFQQAAMIPLAVTGATELRLAVRSIELHRTRIVWDDRVAEPPLQLEVRDVEGRADGTSAEGPVAVSLAGTVASGGTLRIDGTATLTGVLDLTATLDALDLAPLAGYFGRDFALSGRMGGALRARGPAEELEAFDVDLEIADAGLRAGPVSAQGPIALKARLHGAIEKPEGDVEIDATRASLAAYGGAFQKPPGAPATATGRLVLDADGRISLDDVRLSIKNMNGQLRPQPDGLRFDAAPFDLAGWGGLVPALAAVRARRADRVRRRARRVDAVLARRTRRARRRAATTRWARADRAAGRARRRGPRLPQRTARRDDRRPSRHGRARRARQRRTDRSSGAARDAGCRCACAARRALRASPTCSRVPRRSGPISPARSALRRWRSSQGTSISRSAPGASRTCRRCARRSTASRATTSPRGSSTGASAERSLAPYLTDRFESITGNFAIGGGRARTDALVLRYPGYQLELRGSVGLADQRLDLAGRIALGEEILSALAGKPAEQDGGARMLEVARVRGTAEEPEVRDRPGRRDRVRGELRAGATSRQTRAQARRTARRGNRRRAPRRARPFARQEEAGRAMSSWFTLRWSGDAVVMLDQRKLPRQELYVTLRSVEEVAQAIEAMVVRGAPAIGCAAALGVALAATTPKATRSTRCAATSGSRSTVSRRRVPPR